MVAQQILFMVLIFGVFWLFLIRPQMKKQKEHQNMLKALQKGDTVITRGGIVGKISGIADAVVTLELQEKVRVRVLRSYVEGKFDPAKLAQAESAPSDKKKAA